MDIIISRYDNWPQKNPVGYMVGFSITTSNNHTFYQEHLVEFSEAGEKTEEEIVEIAWEKIKDRVLERVERLESMPKLVGNYWSPPNIV